MTRAKTIPLPRPTALSRPHWDGCREGVLRVQRCAACGSYEFIPQAVCTRCQAGKLEWVESSGRGSVYSHTTVYRPPRPEFDAPYVVAIVELEEGWHMLTNLVDCTPEEVAIGLPVEVDFRAVSDEITLPCFRLRRST
ncbi:MAG: Zn-ribbon domain-containing OB-fold protein [Myxococcales bacterium]|nr:Zn-ribbon domain-containing OB-fold protein [Myxococcales bacterium]